MIGGRRLDVHNPSFGAPTSGPLRLVRGATVGVTALGLALAGHVAGGGSLPTSGTSVAVLCLTVAGAVALSGRRWTLAELLTVLLGVQIAFHVAFGNHALSAGATLQGHAAHGNAAHGVSSSMVIGHLLAAFGAALLLRRGESWCWGLMALLGRPVQAVRALGTLSVPDVGVRSVPTGDDSLPELRSLLLAEAAPRRGPPALLAR